MIARIVNLRLKPDGVSGFTRTIENQIIPLLRKQQGFQDQITFVAQGGAEAVGISLWDQKENAEAYNRAAYQEALSALATVVEGTPRVQAYEVSNSTIHKIPAPVVATRIAVTVSYVGPQYGPNQEFIADL